MLAIQGSYAPSLFRVRLHGLKKGDQPHRCPWYRMILVEEGSIIIDQDGISHSAQDGDVCLLPPQVELTIKRQPTVRSIWIAFTVMACQHRDGRGSDPVLDAPQPMPEAVWGCPLPIVQESETSQRVGSIIRVIAATSWNSPIDRLSGNQRLGYILECMVRAQLPKPQTEESRHIIARVHAVITSQLSTIRTASDIAMSLGISTSTLDKSYRKTTGESPMAFLRRYRLGETARLLQWSQTNLQEIAEQVGYRNSKSLTKAWCKVYDLPPRQWRLLHQSY